MKKNDPFMKANKDFNDKNKMIFSLFGIIVALIFALIGYIAWERRTIVKPMPESLDPIRFNPKAEDGNKASRGLSYYTDYKSIAGARKDR